LINANSYDNSALNSNSNTLVNNKQVIEFNPALYPAGISSFTTGSFQLAFGGVITGSIAFNPLGSVMQQNIQTALQNLSTIGPGNIAITSNQTAVPDLIYTVTFTGSLGGAVEPQIETFATTLGGSSTISALPPGTASIITVTTLQTGINA